MPGPSNFISLGSFLFTTTTADAYSTSLPLCVYQLCLYASHPTLPQPKDISSDDFLIFTEREHSIR